MNIEAFFKITYGLYIVCSKLEEKFTGHISNTVFQVTAEPPKIAICSSKNNFTTDCIKSSRVFTISVMQEDVTLDFIGNFGFKSGRDFNKFEKINYKLSQSGCPIVLDKTIAYFDCQVESEIDVGTHILFIGNVIDADILQQDVEPLTYAYYRKVIKGKSPKNSPTYIDKDKLAQIKRQKDITQKKYVCTICGYEYNPEEGDPSMNIPPGTKFEDLPADWVCPICFANKDLFEIV